MPTVVTRNLVAVSTGANRQLTSAPNVVLDFGGTNNIYMFWAIPFPAAALVTSAILEFNNVEVWSSVSVTVTAVDVPWDASTITLANQPAATGPAVTVSRSGAAGSRVSVDITSLLTAVAGGRVWYGVKISTSSGAHQISGLIKNLNDKTETSPAITTTWATPVTTPTGLVPNIPTTAHRISDPSPTLAWVGQSNLSIVSDANARPQLDATKYQVQIDDDPAFGSVNYDTTMINMPQVTRWDTSVDPPGASTPFSATAGTTYYWRVRAQDSTGVTSAWSAVASFIYKAPPTITILTPVAPSTYDPTPTITWSFTGVSEAQTWYGVNVVDVASGIGVYSSGLIPGTATSITLPPGYLWYGSTYRFDLVIFTDGSRVGTADTTDYFVTSVTVLMAYNGTVPNPVALQVNPDANFPWTEIKWQYTDSVPDSFHVMRDGTITASGTPASFAVPGQPTWYHTYDFAPNRTTHIWQVVATIAGVGSSNGNPSVTKEIRHNFSWLTRPDLLGGVMLGNLEVSKDVPGNTTVVEPLSGKPVVVTQGAVTERGRITARLADNIVPATAKQMLTNFYAIRDQFGGSAKLFLYDRILDVFIYDLVQYEKSSNDGMRYDIEFNYIETK